MNVVLHRLDPNIPDPVESRRSAAGRVVRIAYATIVFGVLAFFAIYFGAPLVFLGGPGTVSAPPYIVSLPYTVQVSQIDLAPGATVKAGQEIALVLSPEQDEIVATYMRALADVAGRTAEFRIKARVAQESLEVARSYMRVDRGGRGQDRSHVLRHGDLPHGESCASVPQPAKRSSRRRQKSPRLPFNLSPWTNLFISFKAALEGTAPIRPGPDLCTHRRNHFDRPRASRPIACCRHADRGDPRFDRHLCRLVHSQ